MAESKHQPPPPCDPDLFRNGECIGLGYGGMHAIENWVKTVAAQSNTKLDWHYVGGRVRLVHLGDEDSKARALNAMAALQDQLPEDCSVTPY